MKTILFQKSCLKFSLAFLLLCLSLFTRGAPAIVRADTSLLNCIAFSPYINGYNPNFPNDPAEGAAGICD